MKIRKSKLIFLLLCTVTSFAYPIEKDIKKFLQSRPCYQKAALETESELDPFLQQSEYIKYFVDSIYFCEREDITVVALVKNNRIIGFRLFVPELHYISKNDIKSAVKKVYGVDGFELAADGDFGVNSKTFNSYTIIDREAFEKIRQQAVDEFLSSLKP
ncbi:MAG: hypothetical protein ACFE0O_12445 [Opitutales bacterium]